MARMYARASRSFSVAESSFGLQVIPPLPPPSGRSTTAVFHVIHAARARTVSMVSSACQRRPPLAGPRAVLYCTRYPRNNRIAPSSMRTGKCTCSSR